MLSENTFFTLLDLNPCICFKPWKNMTALKYFRLIVVLLLGTNILISLRDILETRLVDIPSFMHEINMIYYVVSCFFNLWIMMKRFHCFTVDFPISLSELDSSLDIALASQSDTFLFTIFSLLVLHGLSIFWFIKKMSHFNPVSDFMSVTYIVQLAALKHMLSKRLGVLVSRTAGSEDLPETLNLSRQVISLNEKVNASFSLLVVDALTGGLLHLLFSAVAYWRVYGLHHLYDCYELEAPIISLFNRGYFIVILVSIAWPSTKLSDSVSRRVFYPPLYPSFVFNFSGLRLSGLKEFQTGFPRCPKQNTKKKNSHILHCARFFIQNPSACFMHSLPLPSFCSIVFLQTFLHVSFTNEYTNLCVHCFYLR